MKKRIKTFWLKLEFIKASRFFRLFYKHHHKLVLIITIITGILIVSIVAFFLTDEPATVLPRNIKILSIIKEKKIEKSITYTNFDLLIPSIDVFAPVVADVDGYNQREYKEALKKGVAHFGTTAKPDQKGNVFIFGHSTDWQWVEGDYKTIFRKLPDLKKDDDIILQYNQKKYYYKVLFSKVIEYDDMSWLEQKEKDKRVVTLMTCYPIGSDDKRIIIRAENYKITDL